MGLGTPPHKLPPYKVIKTSLASVVRNPEKLQSFQQVASNVSKIATRAMLFLKLYLLHHQKDPPVVTTTLVNMILKTISTKMTKGGRKPTTTADMRADLRNF